MSDLFWLTEARMERARTAIMAAAHQAPITAAGAQPAD